MRLRLQGSPSSSRWRAPARVGAAGGVTAEVLPERRQVVAVVIQREATEYRIVSGSCVCGRVQRSTFPESVTAAIQYGPRVSARAVYLTQYQLLPYQRTAEVLQELAEIAISLGTLQCAVAVAATPPRGAGGGNLRRAIKAPRPCRRDQPARGGHLTLAARAQQREADSLLSPSQTRRRSLRISGACWHGSSACWRMTTGQLMSATNAGMLSAILIIYASWPPSLRPSRASNGPPI